jgi:DNA repair protein RecO (recombination protein O)
VQVKEKLFILRKVRYGDADLILSCLTPKGAKISLFARSAIKSKKRFGGGVLEPTHYVLAMYDDKSGKSHSENPLHTLKEATLIESFDGIRSDYTRLETALSFVKLVNDIVREGEVDSSDIFNILGNTLRAAEKSQQLGWLRTQFEAKLLAHQGILEVQEEEQELLRVSIADHETLSLQDDQWMRVRARIRRVLAEYIGAEREARGD